jgi:hypothetical protein
MATQMREATQARSATQTPGVAERQRAQRLLKPAGRYSRPKVAARPAEWPG